jgi:hypothetical protein
MRPSIVEGMMARLAFGKASATAMIAVAATLSGCISRPAPPPPAIVAAPVPPPVAPRPQPPAGASAESVVPPLGADGDYLTINRNLSPEATIWHVRSALNVAALACRGEREAAIVADYNAMLASKKAVLAAAFARTEAEARATGDKAWRDAHDRRMTQVYNFFAQPPAQARFCDTAAIVVAEAAATPPAEFAAFAPVALARLEAPFTDFYRAFDAYRRDLAAWEAGDGTAGVRLAYAPIQTVIGWSPTSADSQLAALTGR